jgi:hypothetical protein
LGLILGLSLGLGIPAVSAIIGGIVFYVIKVKSKSKVLIDAPITTDEIPLTTTNLTTDSNVTETV